MSIQATLQVDRIESILNMIGKANQNNSNQKYIKDKK